MKSKKIIALISAAAMTMTAFASIPAFADGEGEAATEVALTETKTFDFETTDGTLTTEDKNSTMAVEVVNTPQGAPSSLGNKVLSFTGASTETSKYAKANFDISEYTQGKKRVRIEYDAFFSNTGRMVYAMSDTGPTGYDPACIWSQGTSGSSPRYITADTWLHTVLDITFADGAGTYTYTVTDSEGSVIVQTATAQNPNRTLKTTKQELLNFIATSWSPATAYLDNLTIKTGGTYEYVYAEPEPASTVEGSNINLVPADATVNFDTAWASAFDNYTNILNHSSADIAKTTSANDMSVYNDKTKTDSIFIAFDIYLTPASSLSLIAYGDSGKAQGPSLTFSADKSGVVTVKEQHDSDSKSGAITTLSEDLRHGTWYRVVAEHQASISEEGANPVLGDTTYTVYRIDPTNPSKTSGVAGRALHVPARNLSTRGMSSFGITVSGNVYIDNEAAYKGKHVDPDAEYGDLTTTYKSGAVTVTDGSGLAKTASVIIVSYDLSGLISSVSKSNVTFANKTATVNQSLSVGDKVYVWSTDGVKPLASVYENK